jgi:hypothetical protein
MVDGVERGRAAGLWFVNATQSPKANVLPTEFRDQHGTSAVGKTRTRTMANVIAGDGVFGEHAAEEWGEDAPWLLDVSAPDYRDSGRFILVDGTVRRVRFVRRSREDIARLVAETAWIAERPVVTLGALPEVVDVEEAEPDVERGEPSMDWTRDELADEVERLTGVRPLLHPSGRPPKRELLAMITEAAA